MKKLINKIKHILSFLFKRKKGNVYPDGPVGKVVGVYINGEKIGESKPCSWVDIGDNAEVRSYTLPFTASTAFEPTLEDQLKEAIENEDYEQATILRDKINATQSKS